LAITEKDRKFTIAVADNGVGIPDKIRNQLFDMFFKGNNPNSGSGLGLYIVKQATEKLGGTVDVESTVGEGTTMYAHIPYPETKRVRAMMR
jgi:signal transduction histidine kinase